LWFYIFRIETSCEFFSGGFAVATALVRQVFVVAKSYTRVSVEDDAMQCERATGKSPDPEVESGRRLPCMGQLGREHRDDVQDGYGGEDPDPPHLTVHVVFHIRTSVHVDKQPAS
jgi:hypothetical protein